MIVLALFNLIVIMFFAQHQRRLSTVDAKDFCPTSLVGGVYKIISKVSVKGLELVLGKKISNSENAFMTVDKFWIQI